MSDDDGLRLEILRDECRDRGRCVTEAKPVSFFFPGEGAKLGEWQQAARYCEPCGARFACLELSLLLDERDGVWGGLTLRSRSRVARMRRRGDDWRAAAEREWSARSTPASPELTASDIEFVQLVEEGSLAADAARQSGTTRQRADFLARVFGLAS